MKTIALVLIVILISYFYPRNRFADFPCENDLQWCETEHFGKVPICPSNEGSVSVPSAFYGESVSLGQIGGYFWNGRTPKQDAEEISGNVKSYFEQEAEANEQMFAEIRGCLSLLSTKESKEK